MSNTEVVLPGQWSCPSCRRIYGEFHAVFGCAYCGRAGHEKHDNKFAKAFHASRQATPQAPA